MQWELEMRLATSAAFFNPNGNGNRSLSGGWSLVVPVGTTRGQPLRRWWLQLALALERAVVRPCHLSPPYRHSAMNRLVSPCLAPFRLDAQMSDLPSGLNMGNPSNSGLVVT